MRQVNIHAAKTHLSRLVDEAVAGEEVVIARNGKPIVRLVPVNDEPSPRIPGALRGQIWIGDEFDAPLPDDLVRAFEGEAV
jgi:prevent-host-death family protein